jgi:hypothetical protein
VGLTSESRLTAFSALNHGERENLERQMPTFGNDPTEMPQKQPGDPPDPDDDS